MKTPKKTKNTVTIPREEYDELIILKNKHTLKHPLISNCRKTEKEDRIIYLWKEENNFKYEIHVMKNGTLFPVLTIGDKELTKTIRPWIAPIQLIIEILSELGYLRTIETNYADST